MREKAIEALLDLGISANKKGFDYIVDAIDLISKNEDLRFQVTRIYCEVAKLHENATAGRVERAIRHAFQESFTRSPQWAVDKWLTSTGKITNGNLLSILYIRLKERNM